MLMLVPDKEPAPGWFWPAMLTPSALGQGHTAGLASEQQGGNMGPSRHMAFCREGGAQGSWSPWTWVLQLPAPACAGQDSPSCVPHVPDSVSSADLSGLLLPPTDPVGHKKKQDLRYTQPSHSFRNLVDITEDLLCANTREGHPGSGGWQADSRAMLHVLQKCSFILPRTQWQQWDKIFKNQRK